MAQINIAGTLHNTEEIQGDALNSHVVAHANEILDSTQEKKQSEVNADVETALSVRYTKAETYNKTELDNLITTPAVQYVSVTATAQTTAVTDVLPATGAADTVYRVGSWDGTAVDAGKYSEYAWNGSAYQLLAVRSGSLDGVYDISANNLTEGQPTQYANLEAALGTNGANVPVGVRAGGMQVRFINSTSGKYEQCRLMSASWSTTVTDWQGIDETPTAGSQNLVTSGGVVRMTYLNVGTFVSGEFVNSSTGVFTSATDYYRTGFVNVSGFSKIRVYIGAHSNNVGFAFYSSAGNAYYISGVNSNNYNIGDIAEVSVPLNAKYAAFCVYKQERTEKFFVSIPDAIDDLTNIQQNVDSLDIAMIGGAGIILTETGTSLNYQDILIPANSTYRIKLFEGENVLVYTQTKGVRGYVNQGRLSNVNDSLLLDTTNQIDRIALYPAGETHNNTCVVYSSPNAIQSELTKVSNNLDSVSKKFDSIGINIPFTLEDGYIAAGTGILTQSEDYKSTGYIECKNYSVLSYILAYSGAAGIAFYDVDKNYMTGYQKGPSENIGDIIMKNVPDSAIYFRLSVSIGKVSTFILMSVDYRISPFVDKNNNDMFKYSLGTFENGFINSSNGNYTSANSYRATDYIKLIGEKVSFPVYFADAAGAAFYDSDKTYISGYSNTSGSSAYGTVATLEIPTNAKYIRICWLSVHVSKAWLKCNTYSFTTLVQESVHDSSTPTPTVNPCLYKSTTGCRTFKKILCIGDSLTEGTFEYKDGSNDYTYFVDEDLSYPTFLKCLTGRNTTNLGDGGKSTKTWWQNHQNDDLSGHDACIIALGRNDYGTSAATTSEERSTYMGYIIDKVRTENPQIKIFVATLLNYYTGEGATSVNEDMRDIAEDNDCYLIDISAYGQLNFSQDAYSHLTAEGYEIVANYYFNYISYIMNENKSDFKDIQFIGTNHYV